MITSETIGNIEALFDDAVGTVASEVKNSIAEDRDALARFGIEEDDLRAANRLGANLPHKSLNTLHLEYKMRVITAAHGFFHDSLRFQSTSVQEHVKRQETFLARCAHRLDECIVTNDLREKFLTEGRIAGHEKVLAILKQFV